MQKHNAGTPLILGQRKKRGRVKGTDRPYLIACAVTYTENKMARGIRILTKQIWLALCISVLIFPVAAQAAEVDLDKHIEMQSGKGVAVFSITLRGNTQAASYVKWREVKEDKRFPSNWQGVISITRGAWFGTEELSESPRHVMGRFAALSLPPGTYEFYGFNSTDKHPSNNNNVVLLNARHEFSRRFNVEVGKVQYVGNLDIYKGQTYFGIGGLLSGAFLGMWGGTTEIYPSLIDSGDADIPLIIAKGNGMNAADVQRNVASNEEDTHVQTIIDDLRSKSEKGDVFAQRRLLLGLQNGLAMTEAGEEFKVQKNRELQHWLAEQLSAKGISGGSYSLGLSQEPMLEIYQMNMVPAGADGEKLLGEMLADARRYFMPAMGVTEQIYARGLPGVKEDSEQASLWRQRQQAMREISLKSVPYLDAAGKAEFKKFDSASKPRYFALSASGAYGLSTGDGSTAQAAIAACEARNNGAAEHCRLYARNDWVEWDACPAEYADSQASTFPPKTGVGKIDDIKRLPATMGDTGKAAYLDFLTAIMPRAFAVSDSGEIGMASGDCHAAYKALQICRERSGKVCQLYALDDQIVLGTTDPKLVEEEQRLAALVEQAQNARKLASQSVPAVELLKN